jgi:two-component system chemotaxis sensor kinase CheA
LVDRIHDAEEIVVKPLSRFVRACPCFSGVTILGDGKVAMILDPSGIAGEAGLGFGELGEGSGEAAAPVVQIPRERQFLVLFAAGAEEIAALPLVQIERIERLAPKNIQHVGERELLEMRGMMLPLLRLHQHLPFTPPPSDPADLFLVITKVRQAPFGIVTERVLDALEADLEVDRSTVTGPGLLGSAVMSGRIVMLLEAYGLASLVDATLAAPQNVGLGRRVLLADDTPYFRFMQRDYLQAAGFAVTDVANGEEAWSALEQASFDIVLTDLQMPKLDGVGLLQRIRHTDSRRHLAVIAGSSLARLEQRQPLIELGFDGCAFKQDQAALADEVARVLASNIGAHRQGLSRARRSNKPVTQSPGPKAGPQ